MATPDPEAISELLKQQVALRAARKKNPRYHLEAYEFVTESVDYTCRKLAGRRDVSGRELLDGICDLVLERFGFLAPLVFGHWGILTTDDFGIIVFTLVDVGLLGRSPRDSLDDFRNVFDLRAELERRYKIELEEKRE